MDPTREQIEHVYQNMRYSVRVIPRPPMVQGGPPVEQRILMFATQDESEIHSFPLNEDAAAELSRMLSPVRVAPASALRDLPDLGQNGSQTR